MSRPFKSMIQPRANERIAAFVASYTEQEAKPLMDTIEPIRITDEPLARSGRAFWTANKRAAHVRVERLVEMLVGDRSERSEFVDPGIRRQHIDMPGFCLYGCVDAVEVGKICRIAPDRCGIAADPRDSLVQFGLMAAGDKHPRALLGKMLGDAKADPGAAARDDSDFASEFRSHGEFLSNWAPPARYCTDRAGTFENSEPNPSAIVGWARMASRSVG